MIGSSGNINPAAIGMSCPVDGVKRRSPRQDGKPINVKECEMNCGM